MISPIESDIYAVSHVRTPSNADGVFMKILFCDIDGVLNTYNSEGYLNINKNRLRILRRIVEETGCRIVVSSTWRILPETRVRLMRKLKWKGMEVYGWTTTEQFMGEQKQMRGHEIERWLDENPGVDRYCIIDDDGDMLPSQMNNFVLIDGRVGLTDTYADVIIDILNGR